MPETRTRRRFWTAFLASLAGGTAIAAAAVAGPLALEVVWPGGLDLLPPAAKAGVFGALGAAAVVVPVALTLVGRAERRRQIALEAMAAQLEATAENGYPRLRRYGDPELDAVAAAVNRLATRLHDQDVKLARPFGRRAGGKRYDRMAERVVSMLLEASPELVKGRKDDLASMVADVQALARAGDLGGLHATANEIERAFEDLTQALQTIEARKEANPPRG